MKLLNFFREKANALTELGWAFIAAIIFCSSVLLIVKILGAAKGF